VSDALRYLAARSVANAGRVLLRRLRQPLYLVTGVAGVAWLAFLGRAGVPRAHTADAEAALPAAALGVLVFVVWGWLFGTGARALTFSPAEVTWLLPAPLARAGIVNLKLLRVQGLVLLNSALWVLLVPSADPASTLRRMAGIWCLLSTMALHRIGAGLTRSRAAGSRGMRLAGAAVAGTLVGVALLTATGMFTSPVRADTWLDSRTAKLLLWPFAVPVRPAILSDADGWWVSLLLALVVLALHVAWVHVAERAHADVSAMQSLAHLDGSPGISAAVLRTGSSPIVPLAPTGSPALAIIWKNAASVARRRGLVWALLTWISCCVALEAVARLDPTAASYVGAFAGTWVGFVLVTGPQFIRNDLRHDLPHLGALQALPLHGRTLLAAELASSALTLATLTGALTVVAWLGLRASADVPDWLRTGDALLGALLALPGFSLIVMLVQNAAAVIFPDWAMLTGRSGSAAALGTNLLGVVATMVLGGILLLPALALLPELLEPSGRVMLGTGLMISTVAIVESWLAVRWLGARLERVELTDGTTA
jgi:hypothetical protein